MDHRIESFKPDPRRAPMVLADLDTDTAHELLTGDPEWDRWLDSMAEAEDERHGRTDWIGPNW